MAALPYMPLYVADYLADTAHLTALEHGAYMMLIMNYWQRGKPLPSDDLRLCRIARVSEEAWPAVKGAICEFFHEEGGEWRHRRIDAELERVMEKSAKAKLAAQRSVSARSASAEPAASYTDTQSETEKVIPLPQNPEPREEDFSPKEICLFVEEHPLLDIPKQLRDLAAWCDANRITRPNERRTAIVKTLKRKSAEAEAKKAREPQSTGPPIPIRPETQATLARMRQRA